jgi:hypothetical protein
VRLEDVGLPNSLPVRKLPFSAHGKWLGTSSAGRSTKASPRRRFIYEASPLMQ